MHDWWILLQVYVRGIVIYSNMPEVNYRLHGSNFIGRPEKSHSLNLKQVRKKLHSAIDQAQELLQVNQLVISTDKRDELSLIAEIPNLKFSQKVRVILFSKKRFRYGFFEEVALRIFLVTLRSKKQTH
jgi:hypothetical protein